MGQSLPPRGSGAQRPCSSSRRPRGVRLNQLDREALYVIGYVLERRRWEVLGRVLGDIDVLEDDERSGAGPGDGSPRAQGACAGTGGPAPAPAPDAAGDQADDVGRHRR